MCHAFKDISLLDLHWLEDRTKDLRTKGCRFLIFLKILVNNVILSLVWKPDRCTETGETGLNPPLFSPIRDREKACPYLSTPHRGQTSAKVQEEQNTEPK